MTYSEELYKIAQTVIPGGVNSPVRAFKGVGGTPIFFKEGRGAYLIDVDDNEYIDYIGSWGPMILGHKDPDVINAVINAINSGMSFGAPTEREILLAQKIISLMPCIEKIRMVNSGTEATMTAIRLARGFTKKNKIIKFKGCYHGHNDSLLAKSGSGVLTLGIPSTPGIPTSITEHTLTADFNNLSEVLQIFKTYKDDIAAVIVEPIAGNMGLVLPDVEFLPSLRQLCDDYNSLLIFDEVMTGFRVRLGGAQALYDIRPDLTTLGKVIGGGMPIGAIGGKKEIMDNLAPIGDVYQAGTLSGNPVAMAAGLATLTKLEKPNFYEELELKSQKLIQGLAQINTDLKIPFVGEAVGGMFGFCFNSLGKIRNYQDVANSNEELFKKFYHEMLKKGIYFAPSMFEAGFISSVHSDYDLQKTLNAAYEVLSKSN